MRKNSKGSNFGMPCTLYEAQVDKMRFLIERKKAELANAEREYSRALRLVKHARHATIPPRKELEAAEKLFARLLDAKQPLPEVKVNYRTDLWKEE